MKTETASKASTRRSAIGGFFPFAAQVGNSEDKDLARIECPLLTGSMRRNLINSRHAMDAGQVSIEFVPYAKEEVSRGYARVIGQAGRRSTETCES
jgi:hypothetical protein